jgi:hypothetical protein
MSKDYGLIVNKLSGMYELPHRRTHAVDSNNIDTVVSPYAGWTSVCFEGQNLESMAASLVEATSRPLETDFECLLQPSPSRFTDIRRHDAMKIVGNHFRFAGGGQAYPCAQNTHGQLKTVNTLTSHHKVTTPIAHHSFGVDIMSVLLVDFSKVSDRFDAPPEANVYMLLDLDLLPSTTSPGTALDERAVSILESRQQRDAILLSRDFREALETLVNEEQFSYYDLTQAIGVTRAMLSQWRDRPLEKVRMASHDRMGRLLFSWKYWLHVTEGDMLGRYLRHVPEGSMASLLDLLSSETVPTEEEIATLVDRLARHAAHDRKSGARRRRDIGGLPQGNYRQDLILD